MHDPGIHGDKTKDILWNKGSVWLDYIEFMTQLNQFEMLVSSLIHENNIGKCLL